MEEPDRPATPARPKPLIKISSTLDRTEQDQRWIEAEVMQTGQATRSRVKAPIGLIVVSAEYAQPFTLRVLNAAGVLLAAIDEPSGFADEANVP